MPSRGLFYPNWSISDPKFLFESLLYWDKVACIVPDSNFKPWLNVWHRDDSMAKVLAEGNECLVSPLHPTQEQKARAHETIKKFASYAAPKKLRPSYFCPRNDAAIVSSQKLAYKTVELLRENKWMRQRAGSDMNLISSAAGNLVMAALARECSSKAMPPVTDDPYGFVANCDLVLNELGIPRGLIVGEDGEPANATDKDLSFLLESIPYMTVEGGRIDHHMLKTLISVRGTSDIAGLRELFRDKVDKFLADLGSAETPERQLIRDSFRDAVQKDLGALKKDLKWAGLETITTKEGIIAIGTGALVGTATAPGVGTVLGLAGGLFGYRKTRREKLEKHWTSWLFVSERPRFSIV